MSTETEKKPEASTKVEEKVTKEDITAIADSNELTQRLQKLALERQKVWDSFIMNFKFLYLFLIVLEFI